MEQIENNGCDECEDPATKSQASRFGEGRFGGGSLDGSHVHSAACTDSVATRRDERQGSDDVGWESEARARLVPGRVTVRAPRIGSAGALVMGAFSRWVSPRWRTWTWSSFPRPDKPPSIRSVPTLLPPQRGNRAIRPVTVTGVTQPSHYPRDSTKYRDRRIATDLCQPCTG